ncbi:hypothetical protein HY045_00825 [Candidatus Woesebacteria bacterium]|nr:hypothetical protein [Candidatus Woesebacteria bacterium]
MEFIKKIILNLRNYPILIVFLFGILASRDLLFTNGYFNMHDDLQMMRQLEMEKCFLDFQIPCRWIPDMGYGFGFPLFNFYPPLPYLIGELVRLAGFSFVTAVKFTFALSIVISGLSMYFLAKEVFPNTLKIRGLTLPISAILSALFYIWAPYHAVDVYVRGAMNEAWALAWFPLILLFGYKLILEKKDFKKWMILLSLSWTGLFMSHNIMVMIFTPVFAGWCLIFVYKEKRLIALPHLFISGILALGLSAFFTIPAVIEQTYVQVNTLVAGYYEYIAHFASLNQLLVSRFWGFGPSIWGDNDGMSFQVGHLHWILSLVIIALISYRLLIKKTKWDSSQVITLYLLAIGWFAVFMTHSRSIFIWQLIPPLKFVQFPWRFLTVAILSFSFASGAFVSLIAKKWQIVSALSLIVVLLLLNWNYFKPQSVGPLTDTQKFSGAAWGLQQTAGIYDYLPIDAVTAPKEPQKYLAEVLQGKGNIQKAQEGTSWAKFDANISSETAKVRIGIFKFPNWVTRVDGSVAYSYVDKNEQWGRMYVDLTRGNHKVELKLENTPIRSVSNIASLITWTLLGVYLFKIKFLNVKA